ncbi:LLM class flavin-dependent oxidoreductase [Pilimelia columellifera]|uniref:Luciferase-like domain-containing protein n=1 Tax=Pilimelia columellifera subsp. columellifera TaxID=706583 RepID=A0ABP6AZY0_9ACTN
MRVYEDFVTLGVLSGGHAEITLGRGAFDEPFGLFGYDMDDYDTVFTEHLDLLLQITRPSSVSLRGGHCAPLLGSWAGLRLVQQRCRSESTSGGNRGSLMRADKLRLPVATAMTPGSTARLAENLKPYGE